MWNQELLAEAQMNNDIAALLMVMVFDGSNMLAEYI